MSTKIKEKQFSVPLSEASSEAIGDSVKAEKEKDFFPWRIFVNHVDSYHGKKLALALSEVAYVNPEIGRGAVNTTEEEDEGEEVDEVEEDEATGEARSKLDQREVSRKYEVIGTLLEYKYPYPEEVVRIVRNPENREELLSELMKCAIIIYDVTQRRSQVEEASWVLEAIQEKLKSPEEVSTTKLSRKVGDEKKKEKENMTETPRYFLLISTIMTWSLTKPLGPEDPDLPFTEEDYKKRRAHPNFKEHLRCERNVVIVKKRADLKRKLKTLVICCGITYGEEGGGLHHLLKMAWLNEPVLPIIGNGDNRIPLLHVRDMVAVVRDVVKRWPTVRYVVAVERGISSQKAIVKNISKELTTGRVRRVGPEEAFLYPEITQDIYDSMTIDLNIDPVYILERIRWHFEAPFVDNIGPIVKEYRAWRDLRPMRIIVLGPPASGKSRVARYLVEHYRLHYVTVKGLIDDAIRYLTAEIEGRTISTEEKEGAGERGEGTEGREAEDVEEDNGEDVDVDELRERLNEIRENLVQNDGRLDDVILNKLFSKRLRSKDCSNQGYVIDGYPKTYEQAKILFEKPEERNEALSEEEDVGEEEEDETLEEIDGIMPELVVVLEASDAFLKERIINLSEKEVQGTRYTEKEMIRRLKEYRERNTDDNTPLRFFDETEVHPLIVSVENDTCPEMFPTIYQCLEKLGAPRNYGLSPEEAERAQELADMRKKASEEAAKARAERELEERKREREKKMIEWTELLEKLQEEEEERLSAMGQPLRHYLVRYVFPTLTKGLIEVAKLRPDDPVDFLAEYLFKENPEGRMFRPDYTETMSMILEAIAGLEECIFPKGEELHDVTAKILKAASDNTVLPPASALAGKRDDLDDICATVTSSTSIKEPSYTYDDRGSEYDDREGDFEPFSASGVDDERSSFDEFQI